MMSKKNLGFQFYNYKKVSYLKNVLFKLQVPDLKFKT